MKFAHKVITVFLVAILFIASKPCIGQMRQVYLDNGTTPVNTIFKINFYSPSQGFVASQNWVGFTTDSGRTFTKKPITYSNVNFNGNSVNLTFGFGIMGVKAFDQNNILVYGNYGAIPAILSSSDGGNTYKLVYHSQINPLQVSISNGVKDMVFPENNNIGYAVDEDRILKTTDKGLTWTAIRVDLYSYYNYLDGIDNNNVVASSISASTSAANVTTYTTNNKY